MIVVVRVYPWRFYYGLMEEKDLYNLLKRKKPDNEIITSTRIEDVDGTQKVCISMNGLDPMQAIMAATTIQNSYQMQPNAKKLQILITGEVVYATIIA